MMFSVWMMIMFVDYIRNYALYITHKHTDSILFSSSSFFRRDYEGKINQVNDNTQQVIQNINNVSHISIESDLT